MKEQLWRSAGLKSETVLISCWKNIILEANPAFCAIQHKINLFRLSTGLWKFPLSLTWRSSY